MLEVRLPKKLDDFQLCFGETEVDAFTLIKNPEFLDEFQTAVWKYSGGALFSGRPLDSTIIMMAGVSGSGKSSTINAIFNDNTLCKTNATESETRDIILVQKHLTITHESPALQSTLTFVDVPGMFDTNEENESRNMECIRRFKSSMVELVDRTKIPSLFRKYYKIGKHLYPNIVLFACDASEKRMGGTNSMLRKSLQAFCNTGMNEFVDMKKNNLIIVLTNAMSMGRQHFDVHLKEKRAVIQKAVKEILGIHGAVVVPIENEPEDFNLVKHGDYYQLPNGEFSHLNLFDAIIECLHQNHDLLGRLSVGWYYNPDCPERKQKAEVTNYHIRIDEDELKLMTEMTVTDQVASQILDMELPYPMYRMQCLGYGFCPVTEQIKSVCPLMDTREPKTVEFGGSQFLVPAGISVFSNPTTMFRHFSFMKKQQYEKHMHNSYGLDAEMDLGVTFSLAGKWLEPNMEEQVQAWISVMHETQVAVLRLEDPAEQTKSQRLVKALTNLPSVYNEDTADIFKSFFSRWGTHIIHELALGGCVQLKCMIRQKTMTEENLKSIEGKVAGIFREIVSLNSGFSIERKVKELREAGVVDESLQFIGGDPPPLVTLDSLDIDTLRLWASSVPFKPSELRHSTKLYPYYNLVEGVKSVSLRQATADYLKNSLEQAIEMEFTQKNVAQETLQEVTQASPNERNCFPLGTKVFLADGSSEAIENLHCAHVKVTKLSTLRLKKGHGNSPISGVITKTQFCTYLHIEREMNTEFICFKFDNGKSLTASPGHLLFEFLQDKAVVVGKQAKKFHLGDRMIYSNFCGKDPIIECPRVTKICFETHKGAVCPLTSSGTFFANGFFVSSYAHTSSFDLGQLSMTPLKLYKILFPDKEYRENDCKNYIHPYANALMFVRKKFHFLKFSDHSNCLE